MLVFSSFRTFPCGVCVATELRGLQTQSPNLLAISSPDFICGYVAHLLSGTCSSYWVQLVHSFEPWHMLTSLARSVDGSDAFYHIFLSLIYPQRCKDAWNRL